MNKIYRLVFNKAKGVMQAVAEFASSHAGGSGTVKRCHGAATLTAHAQHIFQKTIVALAIATAFVITSQAAHAGASGGWGGGYERTTDGDGDDGSSSGGTGGTGGSVGTTINGVLTTGANISGSAGLNGGDVSSGANYGGGGGGGGGAGIVVNPSATGAITITNASPYTISGGDGGNGGRLGTYVADGGNGGDGGVGISSLTSLATVSLANNGDISGGNGGNGGAGGAGTFYGGQAGWGGDAIFVVGSHFDVINNSGSAIVKGGNGGAGGAGGNAAVAGHGVAGGGGGFGISILNESGVTTLNNSGQIIGGYGGTGGAGGSDGGSGLSAGNGAFGGPGGSGLSVEGYSTIGTLTNNTGATIQGGAGGNGGAGGDGSSIGGSGGIGGFGAEGIRVGGNEWGEINTLLNNGGLISGGRGGDGGAGGSSLSGALGNGGNGSNGGAGIFMEGYVSDYGAEYTRRSIIGSLTNTGAGATIQGGAGGNGGAGTVGSDGGAGGVGISMVFSEIGTFTNGADSSVLGGDGGNGTRTLSGSDPDGAGGNGGGGLSLEASGDYRSQIGTLTNQGTIKGGRGGNTFAHDGFGGLGGFGVSVNHSDITAFTNNGGQVYGGNGGSGFYGGYGGTAIEVLNGGRISSLMNAGTGLVQGGQGGSGTRGEADLNGGDGGHGGNGVTLLFDGSLIGTLSNTTRATIQGGTGGVGGNGFSAGWGAGNGGTGGRGGDGGVGISVGQSSLGDGVMTSLTNDGFIRGGTGGNGGSAGAAGGMGGDGGSGGSAGNGGAGLSVAYSSHIGTITNTGTISGGGGGLGSNGAASTSFGSVGSPGFGGYGGSGGDGGYALSLFQASHVTTLVNSGSILGGAGRVGGNGGSGGAGYGFGAFGGDGGWGGTAISIDASSDIGTINNTGTIRGGDGGNGGVAGTPGAGGGASLWDGMAGSGGHGFYILDASHVATLTNSGTIQGGAGGSGSVSGIFGWGGAGIAMADGGYISTLNNLGTIQGGAGGSGHNGGAGIVVYPVGSHIDTLTNDSTGIIQGGLGGSGASSGAGIENQGTITTLTNRGVIAAGDSSNVGINNTDGVITTLNNAQGGDGLTAAKTALTYKGALPTNYNAYISSATYYGQLWIQSYTTGSLAFGIASGSTLGASTYAHVLSGISSANISNFSSISSNHWASYVSSGSTYYWSLSAGTGCPVGAACWDLNVTSTAPVTDILGGQTVYTASLTGGGAYISGGTLGVSPSGSMVTVPDAITVASTSATINQNGQTSVFSGVISDAVSGTSGSMTIANSGSGGSVTFSGVNTYTGSTTINSGATLALSGSGSITDSSNVVDNGTFDISQTTSGASVKTLSGSGSLVTAIGKDLTLTNANDTFSGAITGAGKLIVAAGTETMTGTNTHSGGTQVNAGAALSINSGSALGAGALDLVGTSSSTATLNILGTTTIANQIKVSGDPTFNIASGTTTTVSSPIVDGSLPGDVVVAGTGTFNLTAANTYSGQTTVTNGATLALSGSGSIANSSGLVNSGTFNVASANGNVNLASFTQNSSGSLVMGFSPTNNQKILVSGAASLGGALTLNPVAGSYTAGRYTLLSASGGITGNFSTFNAGSLSSYTRLLYALGYDANDVYLTLSGNAGPSAQNTLQSVQMNTSGLGAVINQQLAGLQAGLQYDCVKYDENNLCISVGGRYTYAGSGPSGNAESGLVILGYQPSASWRIGGFVDQSVSSTTPNNIKVGYSGPMWGLFNNWYMNKDRNGLNVQGSLAFANSKVTTTRTQLTNTEPGQGSTQMSGQGYQLQANYVQSVTDNINVIPYLGLRYTRINNGSYTEGTSAQVTSPLSYNAMAQNTFAALAGLGTSAHLAEKLKGTASVGVQQNLNYSMGNYAGTSQVAGLETFSTQMPGYRNTMATASAGIYYDVRKNERIGMNVLWQQQPFINTNTATAIVTYTLGL